MNAETHVKNAIDNYGLLMEQIADTSKVTDRKILLNHAWAVAYFNSAVLLETIRVLNPDLADRMAPWLDDVLQDGEMADELVAQWRDDIAAGRAPTPPPPWGPMCLRPFRQMVANGG